MVDVMSKDFAYGIFFGVLIGGIAGSVHPFLVMIIMITALVLVLGVTKLT